MPIARTDVYQLRNTRPFDDFGRLALNIGKVPWLEKAGYLVKIQVSEEHALLEVLTVGTMMGLNWVPVRLRTLFDRGPGYLKPPVWVLKALV